MLKAAPLPEWAAFSLRATDCKPIKKRPRGGVFETLRSSDLYCLRTVGTVCAVCVVIVACDNCNCNDNRCDTTGCGRAQALKANATSGAWIDATTCNDAIDFGRCLASVGNAVFANNCGWVAGNAGITTNSGLGCNLGGSCAGSHQKRGGKCCEACHNNFSSLRRSKILILISHISGAIANLILTLGSSDQVNAIQSTVFGLGQTIMHIEC